MSYFLGKTVWVTGASSGIGEALAYAFSRQGAKVVLSARRQAELQRVADNCPGEATVLPLDLAQYDTHAGLVQELLAEVGQVDVLVNNGGISQRSLARETDLAVDQKMVEVNLLGTISLTKALLPHFLEKRSGHFVTITSVMGKFGAPMRSGYAAAKHGLHGFFDCLRPEVFAQNVRVTLICPGFVRTEISRNALTGDGSRLGSMDEATDRGLDPDDLARKILRDIRRGRNEATYGGIEKIGVYLKRFLPGLLRRMVRTAKVT